MGKPASNGAINIMGATCVLYMAPNHIQSGATSLLTILANSFHSPRCLVEPVAICNGAGAQYFLVAPTTPLAGQPTFEDCEFQLKLFDIAGYLGYPAQ